MVQPTEGQLHVLAQGDHALKGASSAFPAAKDQQKCCSHHSSWEARHQLMVCRLQPTVRANDMHASEVASSLTGRHLGCSSSQRGVSNIHMPRKAMNSDLLHKRLEGQSTVHLPIEGQSTVHLPRETTH